MLGLQDELQIDRLTGQFRQVAIKDLQVDIVIAAQPVQDIQSTTSPSSSQFLAAVGDALQFAECKAGNDQLIVKDAGVHQIFNPAVNHDAGVEHQRLEAFHLAYKFDVRDQEPEVVFGLQQKTGADVTEQ